SRIWIDFQPCKSSVDRLSIKLPQARSEGFEDGGVPRAHFLPEKSPSNPDTSNSQANRLLFASVARSFFLRPSVQNSGKGGAQETTHKAGIIERRLIRGSILPFGSKLADGV